MSNLSRAEFEAEQIHLDGIYGRLDDLRARAGGRLSDTLLQSGGTPEARSHREADAYRLAEQVAQYEAVEDGLCFGRLDYSDEESPLHIGRIGIHQDHEPLLVDWRAPASRPFYVATAVSPDGISRRRHIQTRDRAVVGLDDELLDGDGEAGGEALIGEAALLKAISANRTGQMRDIVETIQAEQDQVIRSQLGGIMVVQGGPGTGKTAVALHRAAYLLYTYRQQLSARGVLVVGPNATFLRYISQVLPSLAETGVLLATMGDLYPGIAAQRTESPATAEIKGRAVMADILEAAVRDRQRVPAEPITLVADRNDVTIHPWAVENARERARNSGRPHNLARAIFVNEVLTTVALQVADRIGFDPFGDDPLGEDDAPGQESLLDETDLGDLRDDLAPAIVPVLDDLWPDLTPEQLLTDLLASDEALLSAAPQLTDAERARLRRPSEAGWTPSDVPLLDEAAELLGFDDTVARARAARAQQEQLEYAQGVLDITAGSKPYELESEPEELVPNIADVIDAPALAERLFTRDHLSAAARAAADREWVFGHIIVDEAQELSPMAWRLLMRRCPSRSMTVVGDLAQTGALAGASSWGEIFSPYVSDRWRLVTLSVSYRIPGELMSLAAKLMAEVDPGLVLPRPVRSSGVSPWDESGSWPDLAALIRTERAELGDGRLAVIAPAARIAAIRAAVPSLVVGEVPDLSQPAVLLSVPEAKGLEFDRVIVVDPDGMVAGSTRGANDLYVALTRATQQLGVFRPA
jgi:DNA helicase IV